MASDTENFNNADQKAQHPFRKAVIRGLAVVFPPLLTILIFVWVITTTYRYVLNPVTFLAQESTIRARGYIKTAEEVNLEDLSQETATYGREPYHRVDRHALVPEYVFDKVEKNPGEPRPDTAKAYCRRYLQLTWLRPQYTIAFTFSLFILLLYLLGKFMAAGIGRFFWHRFERGIHRLPLIRNVYSSVKQVTDFLFTESEIEYTRVVAVEYPRKGIWSLGLVTGESLLDIRAAANEPILSVLMPTSPMPVTGFTVTVRKSETVDLNITIDQAFQFIVSCGVVVPPQQLQQMLSEPQSLPAPADSAEPAPSGQEAVDSG